MSSLGLNHLNQDQGLMTFINSKTSKVGTKDKFLLDLIPFFKMGEYLLIQALKEGFEICQLLIQQIQDPASIIYRMLILLNLMDNPL